MVMAVVFLLFFEVAAMLHQRRTMLLEDVLGKGLGIVDREATDAFVQRGIGPHLGKRAHGYNGAGVTRDTVVIDMGCLVGGVVILHDMVGQDELGRNTPDLVCDASQAVRKGAIHGE